jgi:hypothetical protein
VCFVPVCDGVRRLCANKLKREEKSEDDKSQLSYQSGFSCVVPHERHPSPNASAMLASKVYDTSVCCQA